MKTVEITEQSEKLTIDARKAGLGFSGAVTLPHIRIRRQSEAGWKYWDTRLTDGAGSLEPHATRYLVMLVAEHGADNVADALAALSIYPPKVDASDALEIENEIERAD